MIILIAVVGIADSFRGTSFIPRKPSLFTRTCSLFTSKLHSSDDDRGDKDSSKDKNLQSYPVIDASKGSGNIEGFLNTDFNSINDGKQWRVFLYVALALVPCLFLIPFFMTRDFVPPTDPEAYKL